MTIDIRKTLLPLALVASVSGVAEAKPPKLAPGNIDKVIQAMTPEEKADLIVGSRLYYKDDSAPDHIKESWQIVPGAAGRINPVPRLGIPAVVLSDGPAGCGIMPLDGQENLWCTHFPIESLLASTWDTDLVQAVGRAIGSEAKHYGTDILLAPAINIHRHPLCGRNFEYFSEDPMLAGKMAAAYVKGVQENGIGTSVKHFAANNQETNRMNNDAIVSERALREIYLKAFEIAVAESNPWTIMSSYNRINGTYASENKWLLTDVLRDEWGFPGVVMTDWWGGSDGAAQMRAGNDMLEPGTKEQAAHIVDGLRKGTLDQAVVDRNVRRILEMIVKTPSFKGYKVTNNPDLEASAAVTREAASEGMVLLKNQTGTLPLKPDDRKIALFGNVSYNFFSGGTGSGDINRPYVVSLLDGLKNHGLEPDDNLRTLYTTFAPPSERGEQKPTPEMPLDTAIIKYAARDNDLAVITLGRISGEYVDRPSTDFFLTDTERQTVRDVSRIFREAGKKTIVVLNVGGVIETMSWKEFPDAILLCWQPGQEGGNSVADILTGRKTPSGKLPMTWPVTLSDHKSSLNFPVDQKIERRWSVKTGHRHDVKNVDYTVYDEGIFVGYRWFDTEGIDVSYPFGFGLSYASFDYSQPELIVKGDSLAVSVTVSNTGNFPGKEVVQLYGSAPRGKLDKPFHELKGFVKTAILQPGESQTLTLSITPADLASFDESKKMWVVEEGDYTLTVSSSSRDPRGQLKVRLNESHFPSNQLRLKR